MRVPPQRHGGRAALGEFELIAQIAALAKTNTGRIVLGIGDDAAVIRPRAGWDLVFTTDALVEGVHFRRAWAEPEAVGWKALAAALSDLAAMGAEPVGCLLSLASPRQWDDADLIALARGLLRCGRKYSCPLVGGNLSAASQRGGLQVHVSVVGEVPAAGALLRSGGRAGDGLWLSGTVGQARLGRAALGSRRSSKRPDAPTRRAIARQLRPLPRLALGRALRKAGCARGVIDVSDGLLADLGHLLEAGGSFLGARLELSRVPVSPLAKQALRRGRSRPSVEALEGGEDYELLFCVPPAAEAGLAPLARTVRTPVTRIGEIESRPGIRLLTPGGDVVEYRGAGGWRHR